MILFYPLFVHAKKFYVTNTCISCGKCLDVCPTNNIRMENKKPVWAENCTHCMACINRCPKEAIEYGNSSKGKVRYLVLTCGFKGRMMIYRQKRKDSFSAFTLCNPKNHQYDEG